MIEIKIPVLSSSDKSNYLINWNSILQKADNNIIQFLNTQNTKYIVYAIQEYETLLSCVEITDYLLIGSENKYIPKHVYTESYYKLGTYYKTLVENVILQKQRSNKNTIYRLEKADEDLFKRGIYCFITVKRVDFDHEQSIIQLMSIYSQLCFHVQHDLTKALGYLQEAVVFSPQNTNINYNLGFIYQKLNKLELSLTHYKLSIFTNGYTVHDMKERNFNYISSYNGISGIYRSIKQWPEALHYLLKAYNVNNNEPNVNNQLGIVYTEMRRTDLAEIHYKKAIENYKETVIQVDPNGLLSEIYMNMGHMYSYNGDNNEAINCYNKALGISPQFVLAYQNKIFNLCYLYNQIEDKDYISQQHKKINGLYKNTQSTQSTQSEKYDFKHLTKNQKKINIGIVSGDFIDHPVSFFINTFLTQYNKEKYNIICYSECIINTSILNPDLIFKFIKHKTTKEVCDMIYGDNVSILFDLSGHTAFNRMDVFYARAAPIQVTYIGYPYTTGVYNMDYRITDKICDDINNSQQYYTEKLIYMDNCFLCYNPNNKYKERVDLPKLTEIQPYLQNGYVTFGCFNRLNKINDSMIKLFNSLLLRYPTCKVVFKTKAIINPNISTTFLNKFDKSVHDRIVLMDCTISHDQHLLEYNKIDLAIDTYPYSGTTTSCESLLMGVPVFSLYKHDDLTYHPQNVTVSLLKNSNLHDYVYQNTDDLFDKIDKLINRNNPIGNWITLKQNVRNLFLNGKVCNQGLYMENFERILDNMCNELQ